MNRRCFLKSSTGLLWLASAPAIVRAITPQQRAAILAQRPVPVVAVASEPDPTLYIDNSSFNSNQTVGRDTTTDTYGFAEQVTNGGTAFYISKVVLSCVRVGTGSVATTFNVSLYSTTGDPKPDSELTNGQSATSKAWADFPDSDTDHEFLFSLGSRPLFEASTSYWVVLWASGINATYYIRASFSTTGSTPILISSTSKSSPTWAAGADPAATAYAKIYGYAA